MKRCLMATTLGALLLAGQSAVWAEESGQATSYKQEWQGMGIGALVGAIAGGPPGLVIGAAGGALMGRHEGLEADLDAARQSIAELERQAAEQVQQLRARDQQIETQRQEREQQLTALAQGFRLNIHFRTESAELEPRFAQQLGVRREHA